ncbi:hypothetical protein GW931_03655 [archaeon]|nr:hypothetical protein [archaeon]PJC45669.1 MAG: hypothetical protein CO037_00285 [Candidatus Pacearchaeota archaeon CG_4_9_14_0_2_um_filter_30_8]
MEKEKIDSVKGFINSIDENLNKLKVAIKGGDEEEFNKIKTESIELTKKIDKSLTEENSQKKK